MGARIKRINGKYYDFGTPNKSFLQVAKDLKSLGIKNFYFMLEIKDPTVAFLDPYSNVLSKDAISRIILECKKNMWYYLREVALIPDQGGTGVHYLANRGNIAQAWCITKGIDSYLNLPRQQGKTQSALAAISWGYSFGVTNGQIIFINKSGDDTKTNLGRVKTQIELLPKYLQFEMILTDDGKIVKQTKNATKMRHPVTCNEILCKAKATSQESALNIARGLTAPIEHFDEVEFTSKIDVIVRNSAPTYLKAADNAKKHGAMFARIFTSTPGDLDTDAGKAGMKIVNGCATWTEKMYDWTEEEIKAYIKNNSSNLIVYIEYSYKQLGLSEEWFQRQAQAIGDPVTVEREILLHRVRGSENGAFSREVISYLLMQVQAIKEELIIDKYYKFDIYEKLSRNIPYIVGIDCATGSGGDSNAITILNPYTVKPAAEFKCNYIGETAFEHLITVLVKKYIPKAILCIERNHVGDGIVDHLLNSSIRNNLYFDKGKDFVEESISESTDEESILKKKAKEKTFYGVWTGPNTRVKMISILYRRVEEYKDDFVTKNITNDISKLVKFPNGKIAAMIGEHDDSIMSYLIALYVYYHGNNLDLFGFIKGSQEIENQNEGLEHKTIDDVDTSLLPAEVVTQLQKEKEYEQNSYEDIFRKALLVSQQESIRQSNAGLVNNIYEDQNIETIDDEDIDIDTDYNDSPYDDGLFDDLNGL